MVHTSRLASWSTSLELNKNVDQLGLDQNKKLKSRSGLDKIEEQQLQATMTFRSFHELQWENFANERQFADSINSRAW